MEYIELMDVVFGQGVGEINRFTFVFNDKFDKNYNQIEVMVYPPRSASNAGADGINGPKNGETGTFEMRCFSYIRTNKYAVRQADLPRACPVSAQY